MYEEILSVDPDVRIFRNFLRENEADYLINTYKYLLKRSTGIVPEGEADIGDYRTSTTAFLTKKGCKVLEAIELRLAKITNMTTFNMEPLQLLNYKEGQEYKYHYDFFEDKFIASQGGQRLITVLLYLNTMPEENGGGTSFWHLNLTVNPIKNSALFWKNLDQYGRGHEKTLHSGLPVLTNLIEKWAINSWIRSNDYDAYIDSLLPSNDETRNIDKDDEIKKQTDL